MQQAGKQTRADWSHRKEREEGPGDSELLTPSCQLETLLQPSIKKHMVISQLMNNPTDLSHKLQHPGLQCLTAHQEWINRSTGLDIPLDVEEWQQIVVSLVQVSKRTSNGMKKWLGP